jgi:hypothetical protein
VDEPDRVPQLGLPKLLLKRDIFAPILWLLSAVRMLKREPLGFFIASTFLFGMMFIEADTLHHAVLPEADLEEWRNPSNKRPVMCPCNAVRSGRFR